MLKYPSIESYSTICKQIKKRNEPAPILMYRGTVKLHGTHGDIVKKNTEIHVQSRNRIITPETDNRGFATFVYDKKNFTSFEKLFKNLENIFHLNNNQTLTISGEWCGGDIQKKIALTQLPEMFVIFGIKINDQWTELFPPYFKQFKVQNPSIKYILDFKTWIKNIDFRQPSSYEKYLSDLTLEVERECPVAKQLGVTGAGEGIVWTCLGDVESINDVACNIKYERRSRVTFKTKGKEHQGTRTKKIVDTELELQNDADKLIKMLVTESRLQQGLDYLKEQNLPINKESISKFTMWILDDVWKEEEARIEESGFTHETFDKKIKISASRWYIKFHNEIS